MADLHNVRPEDLRPSVRYCLETVASLIQPVNFRPMSVGGYLDHPRAAGFVALADRGAARRRFPEVNDGMTESKAAAKGCSFRHAIKVLR